MAWILFYNEPNAMQRDYAFLDRIVNLHGLVPIVIDPSITEETHYGAHFYPTLAAAVADLRWEGLTWVWLDHQGSGSLMEFRGLPEEVIYCVGSDTDGFGGEIYPGLRLRLPAEMVDDQTYASLVIPIICGFHYWKE